MLMDTTEQAGPPSRPSTSKPCANLGAGSERLPDYQAYIASPAWRCLRAKALERDGHRCRLCDAADDLEVHHRQYPARWDLDSLDALTVLCRPCHDRVTNDLRARRYAGAAAPDNPDVGRLTPVADRGATRERVPEIAIPDHRRLSPAHAQLAPRGSA